MNASTTDLFINLVQNHPIVYDKTLKDFKNVRKKEEAWANIANDSRMTVENAKKRYFSLRQKYCREKRNLEVKRRNKLVNRNTWVYYDRLQFLDSFIQPRATFTNDTGFVEDLELETMDGYADGNENHEEGSVAPSQTVDIGVDESVGANDLNQFLEQDASQHEYNSNGCVQEVVSEYTGENSQIIYLCSAENDASVHIESAVNNTKTVQTEEEQHRTRERFEPEYLSPYPTTSSAATEYGASNSQILSTATLRPVILAASVDSSAAATSTPYELPSQRLPTRPATKKKFIHNPASKTTAPLGQNVPQTSARSDQNMAPGSSSAPLVTVASTSKEKSIEMIRHKMDSCLNAIQNKITDKTQRSPHAPFLAYLGTKLPNIPKEIIPSVEEEILEIVKYYSK